MRRLLIHVYHGGNDRFLALMGLDEVQSVGEVFPDLRFLLSLEERRACGDEGFDY